ncbi:MAG: class I SAM-dependent methyltransferase [Rudanella sp.]|nr:class I SAM-dependent methyltransferase [Rudanella sp.]
MSDVLVPIKPKGLLTSLTSFLNRKILRTDRSRWNYQYDKGLWDGLENMEELARFSVLAGYVHFLKPDNPSILEIGCGEGVLAQRIGRQHYGSFLGTDVADAAIEQANSRFGDSKTRFEAVDMNDFQTDEQFDVIIFNEAIYYLKPMLDKLMSQYAPMLRSNGLLIVSMNTGLHADSDAKWEQIEKVFAVVDSTFVETAKNGWKVKILRPLPV